MQRERHAAGETLLAFETFSVEHRLVLTFFTKPQRDTHGETLTAFDVTAGELL